MEKEIRKLLYWLHEKWPEREISREQLINQFGLSIQNFNYLFLNQFINCVDKKGQSELEYYSLGPNGLQLINHWENQKVQENVRGLTSVMTLLTVLLSIIGFTQIFLQVYSTLPYFKEHLWIALGCSITLGGYLE